MTLSAQNPGRKPPCGLLLWALLAVILVSGCATRQPEAAWPRAFVFGCDTFSYTNELVWEYEFDDATGKVTHHRREPPPTYAQHCFAMCKAARQCFQFADFDPAFPRSDAATYRQVVRRVLAQNPRGARPERRIVIPGFTNLFDFSRDYGWLLREECGGEWVSYVQTGHWRMIFPFSRKHQETTAHRLAASLRGNRPPVVHVLTFPSLTINHALLLFGVRETADEIVFGTYDPNSPEKPATLTFNRRKREFAFPRNHYFTGGPVKVYEVYHRAGY